MRPSRGWGFDLCLGVVGKIEPEVSGFKLLIFLGGGGGEGAGALKWPTAENTRLDQME